MRQHAKCPGCNEELPWGPPRKEGGRVKHETINIGRTSWHFECWDNFITNLRERVVFGRRVA